MAIFILIQLIPLPLMVAGGVVKEEGKFRWKGVMRRHWMVGEEMVGVEFSFLS
jgi:hypothetical protein